MIVDQAPLRLADGFLDGVKLLGEIEAGAIFVEHGDDAPDVTLGPLEPLDDVGMAVMMTVCCLHGVIDYPPGGDRANRRRTFGLRRAGFVGGEVKPVPRACKARCTAHAKPVRLLRSEQAGLCERGERS